tara:strand:+ start:194 stop:313 length:120 start_codon:yes stop_codon:yes gene_type:complete
VAVVVVLLDLLMEDSVAVAVAVVVLLTIPLFHLVLAHTP